MGLFSGKTVISVASSVYNLAGDEKDRPNYLKNIIISNVLSGTKRTLGEGINSGYLAGPGIKLRSFFRWASDNYNLIGMPTGTVYTGDSIDTNIISEEVPKAVGETAWVQKAWLGTSDYAMWAEQWILRNYPDQLELDWSADFNDSTKTVHITLPNGVSTSFVASNFEKGARYLFAYYTVTSTDTEGPITEGTWVDLDPTDAFPSVAGYTLSDDFRVSTSVLLDWSTSTVSVYSDGRPDETSFISGSITQSYFNGIMKYFKLDYVGNDTDIDAKVSNKTILNLKYNKEILTEVNTTTTTETVAGTDEFGNPTSVTKTTVITHTEEYLSNKNSYKIDIQKIYNQIWKPIDLFIYKIGTGNVVLDSLINTAASYGQFFPMIPLRLDNRFLSEIPEYVNELVLAKKAFRKATGSNKYSKIIDQIADSEDLADMDYVYTVFGVPLNVMDNSARKYIYKFFARLMLDQSGDEHSGSNFAADMAAYAIAYAEWLAWREDDSPTGLTTPQPVVPRKPTLPTNEIQISNTGINYDIRLYWHYINEFDNIGLGKAGAKKGDIWLQHVGTTTIIDPTYTGESSSDHFTGVKSDDIITYDTTRIYWQYEDNKYKYLDIAGLIHRNFVYEGKNVEITAKQALEDGEESGFIIPLHYATFREMSLIDSTQMGTACIFLVFNVYEIKKKKWWESWFFQIIFFIVIALVSVAFTGGAGLGLLGSHLAVGTALGLTGVSAAIVGAIANALAALVLSTIISQVTQDMGVIGTILGAVLGIILTGAISNFHTSGNFTFNFADLMKADNIIKLMDAAGKGYQAYVQAGITSMQDTLNKIQEDANAELNRIRNAYFEQFGYGGGQIDPMMFVDNSPVLAESRDTFLARTLMSGSDVAMMSHSLLNDYAELTLTLPNAFT